MTELAVQIFLYGLMILASGEKGMSVVLVKGAMRDCDHAASIAFKYDSTACGRIRGAGVTCRPGQGLCKCELGDIDIAFDPKTEEGMGFLDRTPGDRPLPSGENSGARIEWLIRMANVDGDERVKLKNWADIARLVSARIDFGWTEAQNCRFDERRGRVHNFEFVNSSGITASRHKQALSEFAVFETRIPVKVSADAIPAYHLVLTNRGGGEPIRIRFDCADNECPDLLLANRPVGMGCRNEDTGEHFALYAPLLQYTKGLRPHRIPVGGGTVSSGQVQPRRCRPPAEVSAAEDASDESEALLFEDIVYVMTLNGPVICPMVMVSQ